ncbi:AAA family ATPase [Actinoplanes sp. NPDC051343]|uniref:AAA family ATPase n=1 Tax=Actinoplanes sp. NPDC051343 TaxID=3363906 RepID=UPI003796CA73
MDDNEFAAVTDVLFQLLIICGAGQGQVALISGPGATGKSQLLRDFSDHSRQREALVLTTFGSRAEKGRALGLLLQLFRTPGLPPEIEERVQEIVGSAGADLSKLEEQLCALLLSMARDRTVVLAIDDVQYADPESLDALLYIQRRIASARVMMAITEWGHPGAERQAFHAELTRLPRCTRLRLAPLAPAGVGARVREALGERVTPRLASGFAAMSGGNPLLLSALIEDYRAATTGGEELAVPAPGPVFGSTIADCFNRWGPQARDVLGGLALLGDSASPAALSRLLGVDQLTVRQMVEALEATGMVKGGRCCHPAVREAALQGLVPEAGPELYRRAAVLLYEEGAGASAVARHLLAADSVGDLPWAVDVLQRAAGQALTGRDLQRAVDCLDLAIRSCPGGPSQAVVTAALARVRFLMNPASIGGLVDWLREEIEERQLSRSDIAFYAGCLLWRGEALAGGPVSGLPPEVITESDHRLGLDVRMAEDWLRLTFRAERGAGLGDDLARQVADGMTTEHVRAAEQVLQRATVHGTPIEAVLSALFTLQHGGRAAEAAHWCAVLTGQGERLGAATWTAMLHDFRAETCLGRGDPAAAEVHSRRALALLPPQAWNWAIGLPAAHLLMALTWQDKHGEAEAEALASTVLPTGVANTRYRLDFLRARGHYHLAHHRAYAALADFETCGAAAAEWELDVPVLVPWRADATHALIDLGRLDEAKALVEEEAARPGGGSAAARAAAVRLQAAVSGNADLIRPRPALPALVGSSPVARVPREFRPHEHLLTAAEHRTPSLLSQAEQRVATLAARGYTNREISRLLFITISTVEQHLTRVYRKLNVRRRADLAELSPQADSA